MSRCASISPPPSPPPRAVSSDVYPSLRLALALSRSDTCLGSALAHHPHPLAFPLSPTLFHRAVHPLPANTHPLTRAVLPSPPRRPHPARPCRGLARRPFIRFIRAQGRPGKATETSPPPPSVINLQRGEAGTEMQCSPPFVLVRRIDWAPRGNTTTMGQVPSFRFTEFRQHSGVQLNPGVLGSDPLSTFLSIPLCFISVRNPVLCPPPPLSPTLYVTWEQGAGSGVLLPVPGGLWGGH